ncbi:MAG: hypothetical protein DLM53_08935 [Candidatus Eremiobacter antarcticus]|nr:hypothetical protein [Candidatus Eremiobacteraeota bacterium]MBC5807603.1 hypothetical protein [Candidatus Eremiobacteraeota bacterium]PZR61346.1 MAG: hypothetical protein DLM53_08935 [Candidatus Eremiobacter sp. RRmetagenome_bin22]
MATKITTKHEHSKNLRRTAFHEAGHAVMAVLLKLPFRYVTIVPTAEFLGGCNFRTPSYAQKLRLVAQNPNAWDRDRLENEILFYMAGAIAEKRISGRIEARGSSSDRHCASDLATAALRYAAPEEVVAYLKYLSVRASNLVNSPEVWAQVVLIAQRLLKIKKLTQTEVKEVLGVGKFAART